LQDHFEMAEANGDDVSNILNTPVKDYADNPNVRVKSFSKKSGIVNIANIKSTKYVKYLGNPLVKLISLEKLSA
jgi:hypothetical protein